MNEAQVTGDYFVANINKKESGQFFFTLKNIGFNAMLALDEFMETRFEIDANNAITFGQYESMYTNEEVLKELESDNTDILKPHTYYYNYLHGVIKSRIAKELTVIFRPLIAKRLEQTLNAAVMFPTTDIQIPKAHANIAPGVQVRFISHDSYRKKYDLD